MPDSNASATQPQEAPITLEAFLHGQQEINGGFYQSDQELVNAIVMLRDAINGVLNIDLTSVDAAIEKARSISSVIPGVFPPGCKTGP